MDDTRLDRLADEVTGDGLSSELFDDLRTRPPDSDRFATAVDELLPRTSELGRFGLAELSLSLVRRHPGSRRPAEAAIRGADFHLVFLSTLCGMGSVLSGADLLWWYSVFLRDVRVDSLHDRLLRDRAPDLLEHRREAVLSYLLEPERGPGGYLCDSYARVLAVLRDCPPLEERWASWIRSGAFESDGPSVTSAGLLCDCLTTMIEQRIPAGDRLLAEAVSRWAGRIGGADVVDRRRVVHVLGEMLSGGPVAGGYVVLGETVLAALLTHVVPAAERVRLPEAAALREALLAQGRQVRDRDSHAAEQAARSATQRLEAEIREQEGRMDGLPWRR